MTTTNKNAKSRDFMGVRFLKASGDRVNHKPQSVAVLNGFTFVALGTSTVRNGIGYYHVSTNYLKPFTKYDLSDETKVMLINAIKWLDVLASPSLHKEHERLLNNIKRMRDADVADRLMRDLRDVNVKLPAPLMKKIKKIAERT